MLKRGLERYRLRPRFLHGGGRFGGGVAALGGNKSGSRLLRYCSRLRERRQRSKAAPAQGAAFFVKSAVLEVLESFSDQLLKLLRLRGVSLHLVLSKLRLKHQNVLEGLCVADLAGEREN